MTGEVETSTQPAISARQNDGELLVITSPAKARTGSTNGEVGRTPSVAQAFAWNTFTVQQWSGFTAPRYRRFQAHAVEFVAGLWLIDSELFVPGCKLGQIVIDPQTAQLQPTSNVGEVFIHTRGQIIHER